MSSQLLEVFSRNDSGSMDSLDASDYNFMKKDISGLKRVQ